MRYQTALKEETYYTPMVTGPINGTVTCNWHVMRDQLMQQWHDLTTPELEATGHNRRNIARLIQSKYGIPSNLAENYLRNFERTLPLFSC